ncbi:hypothetical protein CIY_04680 [Butyrivibrio fibrisolvens 16/4]|nr:hypothetical protein CIY_04680 [Butyrivibrio fibrisolvens 16/4]
MNELDERYTTSEEAIIDSFFILSSEKEFEKITVSDVVKKIRCCSQYLLQSL